MSTRLTKLNELRTHPILGAYFLKLSKAATEEIEQFVRDNESKTDSEFVEAVNRFKLDQPRNAKIYSMQWALLIQSVDTVSNLRRRKRNEL